MKYLLDTAPWINAVTMPQVLPLRIRNLLQGGEIKGLCSISLLEAAILYRLGRLKLELGLSHFFDVAISDDLRLLELTPVIAGKTNELPADFPGDPFDRTIVATAAALNLTLITADAAILEANACEVEFFPFKRK